MIAKQKSPPPAVTVVGSGPVGATQALLLARQGIDVTLIERKGAPTMHPAAHILNARAMEIWETIDANLPSKIARAGRTISAVPSVKWQYSLLGKTIGAVRIFDNRDMEERAKTQSKWETVHLGQHMLEPMLWEMVAAEPRIDFRTHALCAGVSQTDNGVTATVEQGGATTTIESDYLISAEGAASSIREALGIEMDGPILAEMSSVFFNCPLPDSGAEHSAVLTWIINEDIIGPVIHHGNGDYVLMTNYLPSFQPIGEMDNDWWKPRIQAAIGAPAEMTIKSRGVWTMTSQVAQHYRHGRVFLIGDAAHRFPPTGGYGLNTGVGDAHNLAWKLATVLLDGASPELLESYEVERQPVARMAAQQSVDNFYKMDLVTRHIGIDADGPTRLERALNKAPLAWLPDWLRKRIAKSAMASKVRHAARKLDPTAPNHARLVKEMEKDFDSQAAHFMARGVELGFTYSDGIVLPEQSPKPIRGDGIREYEPSTWPGGRLPLARLECAATETTTLDILASRSLSLLTTPDHAANWKELVGCAKLFDLPIEVISCQLRDSAQWKTIFDFEAGGAVIVRPDGHVVWRTRGSDAAEQWERLLQHGEVSQARRAETVDG